LASTIIVRPSSSSFLLPARDLARRMVGEVFDGQELQHLVGLGAERAFLVGDALAAEPRVPEAFARLAARHHHQVLAAGHGVEFMRDLEGAQEALVKQLMRRRPVISSPSIVTRPEVGGRTPAITLKSVVFPAPFGPISPVIEPVSIRSDAPSTA
jgi:hypothetical protein